jgi:fructose-1,6-bisphosphatase II
VAVLDRPRHEDLIEQIRETGARIQIRQEGDLTPAIAVGLRGSELHAIIGIGGAPEGILAAAVIKCLGGEIQAKMWPTQRAQVEKLKEYGLDDPEKKLALDDLIRAKTWSSRRRASLRGRPCTGSGTSGGSPDAHRGHVDRAPYGTIYGHHPRPRARRRDTGLPTLATQREALERELYIP